MLVVVRYFHELSDWDLDETETKREGDAVLRHSMHDPRASTPPYEKESPKGRSMGLSALGG